MRNFQKKHLVCISKQVLFAFFTGLLLVLFAPSSHATIDGHLTVTSPNGGEVYTEDDMVTITWDASDNIDKVSIGYSHGVGHLNWVAFTAPNTGSYTWKVNVGNTTNTQFVIDIRGYETGKGSLSDKSDGWFTVYQKEEFPPRPEPELAPEPEPALVVYDPPSVSLSADQTQVPYHSGTTIRWSILNANSCVASGAWSGDKCTIGGWQQTGSLTGTRTYGLTCSGPGGTTSENVIVRVDPPAPEQSNVQVFTYTNDSTPEPEPELASAPDPQPAPASTETTGMATLEQPVVIAQEIIITSITQIEINEIYLFEDSKSTDLASIDSTDVNNFTLDQAGLMYFTFLGEVDLSGEEAIDVFESLDEMVYMDYYFFWFEWEFWVLFQTDVEATFYDETNTLSETSPVLLNEIPLQEDEYEVKALDDGSKQIKIAAHVVKEHVPEGEKIKVSVEPLLKVNIQPGQEIRVSDSVFKLEGSVSDSTTIVFANFNGEKIELFVEEDGKFGKPLNLNEGKNTIKVLAYEPEAQDPFTTIEGLIEYVPEKESTPWGTVGVIVVICIVVILGGVLKVRR
ncbi:MAG: hypothetical protein ABIH21_03555 [Patescibacteria group bacterium]